MDDSSQPQQVRQDVVVTIDYELKVNGEIVDTSQGSSPIQFIQGQQNIIPGLEKELYGMEVGDTKEVVVPPQEAYGEIDPDNFADIPRDQFPPDIPLEPGVELELTDEEGDLVNARIESVSDSTVRLDFNHPLAGEELYFWVKVIGLRKASPEELEHGHVHEGHEH